MNRKPAKQCSSNSAANAFIFMNVLYYSLQMGGLLPLSFKIFQEQ